MFGQPSAEPASIAIFARPRFAHIVEKLLIVTLAG
jgi:hypothetical protein